MENKEYLQSMGLKIKDLRIKNGYTQDELAAKNGLYISLHHKQNRKRSSRYLTIKIAKNGTNFKHNNILFDWLK